MQCSYHDWGCVYHACLSDDCQRAEVLANGSDFGAGRCDKTLSNLKNIIMTKKIDIDDLSTDQLAELLEKKRAAENAAANGKREAYESLRTDFVCRVRRELQIAMRIMGEFRDLVVKDSAAFYEIMKEYGCLRSEEQRGYTVQFGNFKIEVKSNTVKGFDERADIAAERLIKFLRDWIKNRDKGEDDPMYQLAMTMIERNRYGQLDYKSVSKLYDLESKFNDPEYSEIMQLFKESNVAEKTATNFYFWEKTDLGVWRKLEPSFNRM